MNDKYQWPVARVIEAVRMTNERWNQSPDIQRDLIAEYEALQAWFWIPSCYSLVEQAIKLLWATRNDIPVDDVRCELRDRLRLHSKPLSQSHNLSFIFELLPSADQSRIDSAYRAFQRLHHHIPIETANEFLEQMGDGYTNWRYLLLEGASIMPRTDIGAMLEIASACAAILQNEHYTDHGFFTVDRRVNQELHHAVFEVVQDQLGELQSRRGFEGGEFKAEFDRQWNHISDSIRKYPDLVYSTLSGAPRRLTHEELLVEEEVKTVCDKLRIVDFKNIRQFFFNKTSLANSKVDHHEMEQMRFNLLAARMSVRRLPHSANSLDFDKVLCAERFLRSITEEELPGLSLEVNSAIALLAMLRHSNDPTIAGETKVALDCLAALGVELSQLDQSQSG